MSEDYPSRQVIVEKVDKRGTLTQWVGLVVLLCITPLVWYIGIPLGLLMVFRGGMGVRSYRCGACGNPVADDQVKLCPTCRIRLMGMS